MKIHVTMRKKMTILFILLALIPIVIIYLVASKLFLHAAQEDMENIYAANITEVSKNVDSYFQNALDMSLYPLMENSLRAFLTTPQDSSIYTTVKQQASEILLTMPFGFSTGIHGLSIYNIENDSISTLASVKISEYEKISLNKTNASPIWDFSEAEKENGYLYLSRLLKNPSNISQKIGCIKIAVSISEIRNAIRALQKDDQTSYFLMAPDNSLTISLDSSGYLDSTDSSFSYHALLSLAKGTVHSQTRNHRIISADLVSKTGLMLYSISSVSALSLMKGTFTKTLAVLSILILIFTILLSFAFSRIITRPLYQLGTHMASISNEDFSVRCPAKGDDEISVLAAQFNHMAERLGFLYNEVYMGEVKLRQSQLDMLQTQINPHFLYNTLDTIYWMSQMGDTKNVAVMVSNMSRMMRLTLSPEKSGMHPLFQELEHLNCYLAIQQVRYGDKIQFQLEHSEALKTCPVLCFLLQPLVENALIHGLSDSVNGIIRIQITADGKHLVYEVSDTGARLQKEELNRLLANVGSRDKRGLALQNINERLKLKFGPQYHLNYFVKNGCSIFQIRQPKEYI